MLTPPQIAMTRDYADMSDEERAAFSAEVEASIRERKAVQQKYGASFDDVTALLFRHDPIGINFDENTDEYEPETGTILPRLESCTLEPEAETIVLEEFRRWFGPLEPSKSKGAETPRRKFGRSGC